jgi:hypothetical protein
MSNFTFLKQASKNSYATPTPSKQAVQNILNYSKAVQVKKISDFRVFFFMNN